MNQKTNEFGAQREPTRHNPAKMPATAKFHRGSWIVTVPIAAIAVGYVTLFFLPGKRAIDEVRNQIDQKEQYMNQTAAGVAQSLNKARQELRRTETYNDDWKKRAPAFGKLSALYGKITSLANTVGTTTTRFDPEPIAAYETIREIPIAVACNGSFPQIFEFLRGIDSLDEEVWVKEMRLGETTGDSELVSCEITLVVFGDNPDISDYITYSE